MASGSRPALIIGLGLGSLTAATLLVWLVTAATEGDEVDASAARRPPRPARPTASAVVVAAPVVNSPVAASGTSYRDTVRGVIRGDLPRFTLCYERALVADPDLAGTVTASFTIQPSGTVGDATAMGLDDRVADCIAGVVQTLAFPAPDGNSAVHITYPFTFRPATP